MLVETAADFVVSSYLDQYNSDTSDDSATPIKSIVSANMNNQMPHPDHSSPSEHIVPGHGQHYHTKDGVIWKEKDPYKRGGEKGNIES